MNHHVPYKKSLLIGGGGAVCLCCSFLPRPQDSEQAMALAKWGLNLGVWSAREKKMLPPLGSLSPTPTPDLPCTHVRTTICLLTGLPCIPWSFGVSLWT